MSDVEHPANLGERVSRIEATVTGMDRYAHEKWHDLNNTLTPLVQLPERMAREMAKMQGAVEGQISGVSRDLERAISTAIEKALAPVNATLASLEGRVAQLEMKDSQQTGAKNVINYFLKSPLVGWLTAGALALAALVARSKHL